MAPRHSLRLTCGNKSNRAAQASAFKAIRCVAHRLISLSPFGVMDFGTLDAGIILGLILMLIFSGSVLWSKPLNRGSDVCVNPYHLMRFASAWRSNAPRGRSGWASAGGKPRGCYPKNSVRQRGNEGAVSVPPSSQSDVDAARPHQIRRIAGARILTAGGDRPVINSAGAIRGSR